MFPALVQADSCMACASKAVVRTTAADTTAIFAAYLCNRACSDEPVKYALALRQLSKQPGAAGDGAQCKQDEPVEARSSVARRSMERSRSRAW